MQPVSERVPLEQVVNWWLDMWEWRTAELNAGRIRREEVPDAG